MGNSEGAAKQTWIGIPRGEIDWYPAVEPELCIGCGICVMICGRGVFRFDYERNLSIVANPSNCVVGCTTCMNVCPQQAISFPPISYLRKLIKGNKIIQHAREALLANRAKYEFKSDQLKASAPQRSL